MSENESEPNSLLPPKEKGVARLIAATRFSLAGLKAALQHEEAFRLEVVIFCFLTPLGLWLGQSRVEQVLLVGSLFVVLLMELINSALEAIVDRAGKEFHALAGRAKDIGSAAVFVALLLVVFTWGMLLL
ncbi:MAG: diacylglycerol kinase [SAR86 cluster bacterium]|uniref:Diacylglycerol kinase n=1 Tax=SAR86 cluster bacterium TaxID=2030880 RepID=A0A2A4WYF2_9GAMM|nr:MAG: diacylglycerol kinase [SAR86 cluster bacterium]